MIALMLLFCGYCVGITSGQVTYLNANEKLTEVSLRALAAADDPVHFNSTLHSICVPRVVGTAGHEQVKDYLIGELKAAGLTVQLDTFTKTAPIVGKVRFTNIIARLNPDADRFLALACHYDSKYFPAGEHFVGAIDSAVPCAMLLNAVRTLSAPLAEKQQGLRNGAGLMLIFFDGEEAFDTWTDTDSLYGSRHLARKMRDIDQIDALVLLDLIGAANPTFYNYFRPTVPLFQRMVEIERGLVAAGLMQGNRYMFHPRHSHASIADDHLPFEEQGVPIVHLITNPFPPQWHKAEDDLQHLDADSMANFNKILRSFTYEYLVASQPTANFRIFGGR